MLEGESSHSDMIWKQLAESYRGSWSRDDLLSVLVLIRRMLEIDPPRRPSIQCVFTDKWYDEARS